MGSRKLQTTFEKTGSGRRERGRARAGRTARESEREREKKDRESRLGFEVTADEVRETVREVN